jgi:PD-(D/E)XK endonuclease
MAPLKQKGDLAELMVAADLRRRGYKLAFPYGEDWDYDLIIERHGKLERIQVKYCASDGCVVPVKCYSHSLTNGRVRATKRYTADTVDWIAVWDATSGTTYYVSSSVFDGYSQLSLRLVQTRNNQTRRIRNAADFLEI